MDNPKSSARWMRLKEVLITTTVGWLPTLAFGVALRNFLYRKIFKHLGSSVYIQEGAEFIGASTIEIGDGAHIFRGVRLDGRDQNSRIWIGDRVALERGVVILTGENCSIEIGENTYIGHYTCLGGPGRIKIGKDCQIASHCGIFANNHNFADLTRKIKDQGLTCKGIVIEDDCWLGHGVTVLDGVTLGQGSVIGAGSVVTKDIPPYSIAVGAPARVIRSRKTTELVTSTRNQKYLSTDSSRLPVPISDALTKVENTAELLHQCLQTFNGTVPPPLVFEKLLYALLDCIRQVMEVDTVTILLRTEAGQQLTVHASLGLEEEIAAGIRIPIGHGFAGNIAARNELMIVDDLSTVEVVSPILRNKGIQSMLGVPLLSEDRMIGVFHIGTFRPRHFNRDDAHLMQLIADRLGLAIAPLLEHGKVLSPNETKVGFVGSKYVDVRREPVNKHVQCCYAASLKRLSNHFQALTQPTSLSGNWCYI